MSDTENSSTFNITGFPQCPVTMWNMVMIALGVTDCALSLPMVPWALWVLLSSSRTVLETELFILNVLLADIGCIVLNLISYLYLFVFSNVVFNKIVFGLYCVYLNGYPLFQCCVCFEQYMAVVHPFSFLKYKPLRYKAVCLSLMWLLALTSTLIDWMAAGYLNLLLIVLIPVVCVQTFFSLSILMVLKRNSPGDKMRNKDRERERNNGIKKRAFVVVIILHTKLLANYLPFIMLSIFKGLFHKLLFDCYISQLALTFCLLGHFIHSFLYLQKVGRLPIPQGLLVAIAS